MLRKAVSHGAALVKSPGDRQGGLDVEACGKVFLCTGQEPWDEYLPAKALSYSQRSQWVMRPASVIYMIPEDARLKSAVLRRSPTDVDGFFGYLAVLFAFLSTEPVG